MNAVAEQAPIERVIERIKKVYGSWNKTTTVAQMRDDWDDLLWSDTFPAKTEAVSANGVDAMWIDAADAAADKVLLYFHGGGFRVGSVRSHRDLIARISAGANCRALGVNYRRSPEHHFPAPIEDAMSAYQWLLDQGFLPDHIALVGDSAGGGVALSLLLALRAKNLPLPVATVTMSVWSDLTASGESYITRAAADPIHQQRMIQGMAKAYLNGAVPRDPQASPLFADLHGLPPLLLQVGDRETVLDDSRNFVAKACAAGVDAELEVWDGMIHVFQQFTSELPEALQAIESIGCFLKKHWPTNDKRGINARI